MNDISNMSADDVREFARMQFKAILDLPEATGKETLAIGLAKGGMSVEAAKTTLAAMPDQKQKDNRLQQFVEEQRSKNNDD